MTNEIIYRSDYDIRKHISGKTMYQYRKLIVSLSGNTIENKMSNKTVTYANFLIAPNLTQHKYHRKISQITIQNKKIKIGYNYDVIIEDLWHDVFF